MFGAGDPEGYKCMSQKEEKYIKHHRSQTNTDQVKIRRAQSNVEQVNNNNIEHRLIWKPSSPD